MQGLLNEHFSLDSEGKLNGIYGKIKNIQEDVDTRFLLIDSGLRFFNDTVYRDQQVKNL